MTVAMTIAGSDPSGGAGVQADLKTFHQHGVYGTSVVTLLTVQNTRQVESVEVLRPEFVVSQLNAVLDDIPPTAAKTGALGNAAVIEECLRRSLLIGHLQLRDCGRNHGFPPDILHFPARVVVTTGERPASSSRS